MIDYESVFLSSPCPQAIFDTELHLLSCNDAFAAQLGISVEVLYVRPLQYFFVESEWLVLKSEVEKLRSNALIQQSKICLHTADIQQVIKKNDWNISLNQAQQHLYIYLSNTRTTYPEQIQEGYTRFPDNNKNLEITKETLKKQNEQIRKTLVNLINTQKMIRGIAETVPAALTAYHIEEQKYIFNNKKLSTMLGYSKSEFEKLFKDPILENIHPSQRQTVTSSREKILSTSNITSKLMLKHKDGTYKWVSVNVVTLQDYQNKVYAVVTMLLDINEMVKYENELKTANLSLQENQLSLEKTLTELSNRNYELDQLVYKISHDLRSPLSSILGLVNIYKIEDNPEKKHHYVDLIENRIHKLDGFVKEMLNYARTSRSEITMESIDFDKLIQSCLEDLEYVESAAKINVRVNIIPKEYLFCSDKLRIKIVLNNIISNAFKYYNPAHKKPSLKIDIHIDSDKAFIHLKDNGIGIQKEYLHRIFDMFFRATEKSDGAGLGMYIVKQTVERLQGSVNVESVLHQGTAFKIQIPNLSPL